MSAGEVSVILISHEHLYTGVVRTHGRRLLDMLNDTTTDYLMVQATRVFRTADVTNYMAEYTECIVRKSSIHLALIASRQHETPEKRLYAFVPKRVHPVFLSVAGYEVQGNMHLSSAPDPLMILTHQVGDFFPITQAAVSYVRWDSEPLTAPVALVQKASLSLFHIAEAAVPAL